jgi:LysM repeat protein
MDIKRLVIPFVFVFLLLALVACERPASTPPGGEATATTSPGDFPVPGSTDDVMSQLEAFATQTEMAKLGGTPQAVQPSPTLAGEIAETSPATEAAQPTEATGDTSPTQAPTQVPPAQPTNPPAPVPTKTPGLPKTHTLKSGEFPYCIARRYDVNPNEMLRLSGLSGTGMFRAGTVLKIPQSGNKFPGNRSLKSHPTTYTVRSGDTIYTVACSFGAVDPNDIIAANSLTSPYKLTSGQSLYIP